MHDFEGFLEIEDCLFNFNEQHGMYLANGSNQGQASQSVVVDSVIVNNDNLDKTINKYYI